MNSIRPKALIIGHSFVRRLRSDLERNFDARADIHFGLDQSMDVFLYGVGGLTVSQLRGRCSRPVRDVSPDIVLLEIGTNDLGIFHQKSWAPTSMIWLNSLIPL